MEKQQYLKYFQNQKTLTSKNLYKNKNQYKVQNNISNLCGKKEKKILPHITEQYQFKITNHLLLQKIMNPKRDRLIAQNFSRQGQASSFSHHRLGQKSTSPKNSSKQNNTKNQLRAIQLPTKCQFSKIKARLKQKEKQYKNFNISLQNDRMGKRIVNTKSCVQQLLKKTFFTYKKLKKNAEIQKQNIPCDLKSSSIKNNNNKKILFTGKLNKGVKIFFNNVSMDEDQINLKKPQLKKYNTFYQGNKKDQNQCYIQQENYQRKKIRNIKTSHLKQKSIVSCNYQSQLQQEEVQYMQTNYPEAFRIFGRGPTILMISNLQISSNPQLKDNTVILLQLIIHEKKINFRKNKQKTMRSLPLCYDFFKKKPHQQISNFIRFAINVSQIGDFVPLRIYRISGVQQIQIGIIDIDLSPYRFRKAQILNGQNDNFYQQVKTGTKGQNLVRQVVSGNTQGNLRKNILNKTIDVSVKLQYKIYSKKFRSIE